MERHCRGNSEGGLGNESNRNGIDVRRLPHGDAALCRKILEALPEWFGIPDAIERYIRECVSLPMFEARAEDSAVGLISLCAADACATRGDGHRTDEIHVMGVLPAYHRRGIGRVLLETAAADCRARGAVALVVKTLSPAREDVAYAATRKFYLALGFRPHREIPDLWGPDNPCLEMVLEL